jgi:hypothetical protein
MTRVLRRIVRHRPRFTRGARRIVARPVRIVTRPVTILGSPGATLIATETIVRARPRIDRRTSLNRLPYCANPARARENRPRSLSASHGLAGHRPVCSCDGPRCSYDDPTYLSDCSTCFVNSHRRAANSPTTSAKGHSVIGNCRRTCANRLPSGGDFSGAACETDGVPVEWTAVACGFSLSSAAGHTFPENWLRCASSWTSSTSGERRSVRRAWRCASGSTRTSRRSQGSRRLGSRALRIGRARRIDGRGRRGVQRRGRVVADGRRCRAGTIPPTQPGPERHFGERNSRSCRIRWFERRRKELSGGALEVQDSSAYEASSSWCSSPRKRNALPATLSTQHSTRATSPPAQPFERAHARRPRRKPPT